MTRLETIESALILVALASLWPLLVHYHALCYTLWLLLMLAGMAWVAIRRLRRIRAAADHAKRKRDEAQRSRRPPRLIP